MTKRIQIKYVKPSSLKPATYNPRTIDELAFAGLRESLKKFGLVDPILVNKTTGNIVGGHQRLKAAEANGETEVPVIELELSPAEEKALNLTLNNPNISGRYTDTVNDLMTELRLDLGDDYLADLRLDTIEIPDWNSDIATGKVENTDPNLEGIEAKVVCKMPQSLKDDVKAAVMELVASKGSAWDGVVVA